MFFKFYNQKLCLTAPWLEPQISWLRKPSEHQNVGTTLKTSVLMQKICILFETSHLPLWFTDIITGQGNYMKKSVYNWCQWISFLLTNFLICLDIRLWIFLTSFETNLFTNVTLWIFIQPIQTKFWHKKTLSKSLTWIWYSTF